MCELNSSFQFEFDVIILKVTGNDRYCLVLLANGDTWKLCIQTLEVKLFKFLIIENETQRKRQPIFLSTEDHAKVDHLNEEIVTDIGCCQTFSVALTSKNNLYVIPSKIYSFTRNIRVIKICCGIEHCMLLTANGDVYVFGSSRYFLCYFR